MRALVSGALVLVAASLGGCALFPGNINSPNSIFSDKDLGERRAPQVSTADREAQEAEARAKAAEALVAGGRGTTDEKALATRLRNEADTFAKYAQLKAQKGDPTLAAASGEDPGVLAGGFERDVVDSWSRVGNANATPTDAQAFLYAGVALVDHRCGMYFRALGLAAQKSSFASKELGLTTGVVAALQGLTGVASKDIAIVASSLGFLGASSQAYNDSFIFSPDVGSVETLVLNSQQAIKLKFKDIPVTDFNKTVAIGSLQGYEKTCEVKTIRRLINESLSSAHPIAGFQDDTETTLDRLTRATLVARMGVDAITDDQLTALYWIAYKATAAELAAAPPSAETAYFLKALKDLPKIVTPAGVLVTPQATLDATIKEVKTGLAPIVGRGTSQLDAKVLAMQRAAAGGKATVRAFLFPPALTVTVMPGVGR